MATKKPMKKYADGGAVNTGATVADKIKKYREAAKDKSLPQDVRNTYLDKANELEQKSYKPAMAKGGAVKPKSPVVAVMIGLTDKKAMKPAVKKAKK